MDPCSSVTLAEADDPHPRLAVRWASLDRCARSRLAPWQLLWLWLDLFAFVRPDALDHPDPFRRRTARLHNAALRRYVPRYVARWLAIHALTWVLVLTVAEHSPPGLAVGVVALVTSLAAATITAAGGALLGRRA